MTEVLLTAALGVEAFALCVIAIHLKRMVCAAIGSFVSQLLDGCAAEIR